MILELPNSQKSGNFKPKNPKDFLGLDYSASPRILRNFFSQKGENLDQIQRPPKIRAAPKSEIKSLAYDLHVSTFSDLTIKAAIWLEWLHTSLIFWHRKLPSSKLYPSLGFFRPKMAFLTLKMAPKAPKPTSSVEKPRLFCRRQKGQRYHQEICDFLRNHRFMHFNLWLQYVINGQKVSRFLTSFILWPKGWSVRTSLPLDEKYTLAEGWKGLCLWGFGRFP